MIRLIRSAAVLAGIIGMTQPCFADPSAALAQAYAAAAAEQPATQQPKAAAPASAPDAAAPADRGKSTDLISVGFGWG
jgi:septal ring-binding cell division protein DamX